MDLKRIAAGPAEVPSGPVLVAAIRNEIVEGGPMTFARFMEIALYDPARGYYRGAVARPGRAGDFLTAPEASPIFGWKCTTNCRVSNAPRSSPINAMRRGSRPTIAARNVSAPVRRPRAKPRATSASCNSSVAFVACCGASAVRSKIR